MANLAASGVWADCGVEFSCARHGDRADGAGAVTGGASMRWHALCTEAASSPAGTRPACAVRWPPNRAA